MALAHVAVSAAGRVARGGGGASRVLRPAGCGWQGLHTSPRPDGTCSSTGNIFEYRGDALLQYALVHWYGYTDTYTMININQPG